MSKIDLTEEESIISIEKLPSEKSISKIMQIKTKLTSKLDVIERDISTIEELKQRSIEEIENKKMELRDLINPEEINREHSEAVQELAMTEKEIEARRFSITKLDETIANLDMEIARIQSEHEKAVAELKEKWRKLNERLEYYEKLNEKITELANMIKEQGEKYDETLTALMAKRSELLKRTDLSETTLNEMLRAIDDQMETLQRDHDAAINAANETLLDYTNYQEFAEDEADAVDLLSVSQIREIETFETGLRDRKGPRISKQERLSLLQRGCQITPSGRVITQDDRVLTLDELRQLGYLASGDYGGGEEGQLTEEQWWAKEKWNAEYEGQQLEEVAQETGRDITRRMSVSGSSSSETVSSAEESGLSGQDTEYLKQIFGKSLAVALAEITAIQPADPIHYLAHWLFRYRYNQEADEVRKKEVQALIDERQRLATEKWHTELEREARLAVEEALFRAENIILQKEYAMERLTTAAAAAMEEGEGEFDSEIPYPSELALLP